ncbi:MAG: ChbG/HpnK family deacetylase [Solirubrobacteraceae bacterium]
MIITADDFGLDAATNRAIVRAFADGLVSNASVLVNLPGFEEACELARQHGFQHRVGLHFNVTEGAPLTDAIRRVSRFCLDGLFVPSERFSRCRPLSAAEKAALAAELEAQIAAARAQGLSLTHVDSHNDVHAEPAIAPLVVAVARTTGIPRVRPARNCGARQGVLRWVEHRGFNAWLNRQGFRHVRYFGTVDDVLWLAGRQRLAQRPSVEVMTHPRPGPQDTVIDAPFGQSLASRVDRMRAALK